MTGLLLRETDTEHSIACLREMQATEPFETPRGTDVFHLYSLQLTVERERQAAQLFSVRNEDAGAEARIIKHVCRDLLIPLLSATSRDEFWKTVGSVWRKYREATRALGLLVELSIGDDACKGSEEDIDASLLESAEALLGEDGRDEFQFILSTASRARRMTKSLGKPKKSEADQVKEYWLGTILYQLGSLAALIAPEVKTRTKFGVDGVFEMARRGALDAYVAARTTKESRKTPNTDFSELPFDDEDSRLARLT